MKHARSNSELPAMCVLVTFLLVGTVCVLATPHSLSLTNAAAEKQELQLSLQHLSYRSVHRMLRDENEPANYKGELRYYQKRETQSRHEIQKREISIDATLLNLTAQGLSAYDSQTNYQGQFDLVTRMDLSNNNLNSLKLDNFVKLQQLDVSNNSLSTLPDAIPSLVTLDLSCNQFGQLSASFFAKRMPQLKHLNLANNQLGNISRQAFYNLISLQSLLLSNNNITDIDYETFLALPNLQHLDLSHNQLSGLAIRALQGIPDLVSLSIAHNPQVGAAMQEFVASWSLKELDASGTGLCQVPAALAQSVRTLKLSHNWLKAINCGDLDSYPLLQYLDLSHSQIAHVEDDALGRLELLELLFLDHNSLVRVPNSLPTSLEHLFLQHNQIMELQPQVFAALTNLQTLDLSENRLLYLPALPLPKLLTLNLQSSGIESVSQSIVHTLPQLRDLLLEDNPIRCNDLLGIAEWASPCRSSDMGQSPGRIDLKQRYVQLQNFYEPFSSQCGRSSKTEDESLESMPPTCSRAATTTEPTLPKVHKSKAAVEATTTTTTSAMQSSGNNIVLVTAKTLGPVETTSLVKLQRQQMPGMPTATTIRTTTLSQTATASGMPSLYRGIGTAATATAATTTTATTHRAANRRNILAAQPTVSSVPPATTADAVNLSKTTTPKMIVMPTDISDVAVVGTIATTTTTTAAATEMPKVPQTISTFINSKVADEEKRFDNATNSLLKQTVATATADTLNLSETSGQEVSSMAVSKTLHKHTTLQLHIKDRHLIGTPLLMHKGDNLMVDAEHLLLPGTATVADAETLDGSQQQRQETTDKRQPEVIKGDTKATAMEMATAAVETAATTIPTTTASAELKTHKKKNPSLSIKKMTYSTKHATTVKTTAIPSITTTTTTSEHPTQHQHSSVNTPNAVKQELNTFAQLKAFVELKTEASKSAQLLDTRQETQKILSSNHPGLMLLLACILVIVLLAGLAHVYRCELPWQRNGRNGQTRPHHQRQFNENDDVHSFLHYQGSRDADPARLSAWHHSTRREAPYSSPLHNLQARELQREQQKLQFYSATLADSSIGSGSGSGSGSACSSGSSRSSLHSPNNEDSFYIEMAPSSPNASSNVLSSLPMELLSNRSTDGIVAATELGATLAPTTKLRSVSSKLMAPSTRRLGIW